MLLLLIAHAASARGGEPPDPGPNLVAQASPGLHLALSDGKPGLGLSLDVLGGAVLGDRTFDPTPGIVAGGFAQLDVVLHQGTTFTVGGRAGAGALGPTMFNGYVPFGLLTVDRGASFGACRGRSWGAHVRSFYLGTGLRLPEGGGYTATLGPDLPLVPIPAVP